MSDENRCFAWSIHLAQMDSFLEGPKYYLPFRCSETRLNGEDVCAKCFIKRAKPRTSSGLPPGKWWGLITEPIQNLGDQVNHMAFSPWWYKKAKRYHLSEESMGRAKKLLETAVENVPSAPSVAPVEGPVNTKAKKGGGGRKKVVADATATPKQVKKKPILKKPEVVAVLSNEEPINPESVVHVNVRAFEHEGAVYYLEPKKSKLYEKTTLKYKGRWDSVAEKIVTGIPDSDAEL